LLGFGDISKYKAEIFVGWGQVFLASGSTKYGAIRGLRESYFRIDKSNNFGIS
jgi:hypothetical protein